MKKSISIPEVKPPPWANRRTKMLCIRLTEVELECLREDAREKGFGVSTLVRSLIKSFLNKKRTDRQETPVHHHKEGEREG